MSASATGHPETPGTQDRRVLEPGGGRGWRRRRRRRDGDERERKRR